MKNTVKIFGIIALTVVFAFSLFSCSNNKCPKSTSGEHEWFNSSNKGTICLRCNMVKDK